jgi:hypothetical protein
MKNTENRYLKRFKTMRNVNVHEEIKKAAIRVACKQIEYGESHGNAIDMFYSDGCPCIRWQDGQWWHYNIVDGTWF